LKKGPVKGVAVSLARATTNSTELLQPYLAEGVGEGV
jgi:hypothetical protein